MEEQSKTLEQMEQDSKDKLDEQVTPDNPLKEMFLDYVGTKMGVEDGGAITIDMCVRTLAEEFPEFLEPVCEQNYMLGYYHCQEDFKAWLDSQAEEQDEQDS